MSTFLTAGGLKWIEIETLIQIEVDLDNPK